MKHLIKKRSWLPILFFLTVAAAYGQKPYSLKSHKVTIDGTSSLHDWTSDATKLEWKGTVLVEGNKLKEAKDVTVSIPVKSIKSTKGKTMDEKTYEAFKSDKNPAIIYKLTQITESGGTLKAVGTLTMAGATKSLTMDVTAKVLAGGDVQFTGKQKLNMKDFKMDPPTAMMGTIKVGPDVTVNFDLTVSPSK